MAPNSDHGLRTPETAFGTLRSGEIVPRINSRPSWPDWIVPITPKASGARLGRARTLNVQSQSQVFEGVCPARRNYSALFEVARNSPTRPFKAVTRGSMPLGLRGGVHCRLRGRFDDFRRFPRSWRRNSGNGRVGSAR